jgi:hypothetical protein
MDPREPLPTEEEPPQTGASAAPETLGREWLGPGLLLAGALALGRVELLVRLAQVRRGVDPEWARWSVMGEWQAELIQALVMGAVAAAVIWSGRGTRRPLAVLLGAAILASALSGWPVAPPDEIATGSVPGIPELWLLVAASLAIAALVSALAWLTSGQPALGALFSRRETQLVCALIGLGGPAYLFYGASTDAPQIDVRGTQVARARATREAPNLLLIAVDGLRHDRVGFLGSPRANTPALDELARNGLAFERAFAPSSWAAPSLASLFTGLEPDEHGLMRPEHGLLLSHTTLAETLGSQGVTTSAVVAAPELTRERGFAQGFEHFDQIGARRSGAELLPIVERELGRLADVRFFLCMQVADLRAPRAPPVAELERIGAEEPEDFPGLQHYAKRLRAGEGLDAGGKPHPAEVVPQEHARWIRQRYDACVGAVDRVLDAVLARLEELNLVRTTLVVVVGTHGEELLEHGQLGHGHGLWSELVGVPMVIAGPGIDRARVQEAVSLRHLAPSLAQRLGNRLGHDDELLDLFLPQLTPERVLTRTSIGLWQNEQEQELFGLRGEIFSLLGRGRPEEGRESRFFALEGDPGEHVDLMEVEDYRDEATSWEAALQERVQELRSRRPHATEGDVLIEERAP